MGIDLYMVTVPDDIPDHYPEQVRQNPGYFRGVPDTQLREAGILDDAAESTPRSRTPGKVPAFKFAGNDGWLITPKECRLIAHRLAAHLEAARPRRRSNAISPSATWLLHRPDSADIPNPTLCQLALSVHELHHEDDNPFLILNDQTRPNSFMQTLRRSARLFVIEYAEGDPQQQYRMERVTEDEVRELFGRYLNRDQAFKSLVPWWDITDRLFGESRREAERVRAFIAFNELAARHRGYRVY